MDNTITYNVEEYDALAISAYDCKETYEYFSMCFDLKIYNSSFELEPTDITSEIGSGFCNFDVNPGFNFFLISMQVVADGEYPIARAEFLED